jgi:BirA family biotin operon repressor/biotin-[acetyl-CoA-carboxylase] ligase
VGIGLNVNQVAFATPRATSIALILNQRQDRDECLNALLCWFAHFYDLLQTQQYQTLCNGYNDLLYRKTGLYKYCAGGEVFLARIINIGNNGDLLLQKESGETSQYQFKQVAFVH